MIRLGSVRRCMALAAMPLVVVSVFAATLTAVLPAPLASAAPARPADTVTDLKARAADIARKLDDLGAQSSKLDEDFNAASLDFEKLTGQATENQAAVDAARSALDGHRVAARGYAISAYTGGGEEDPVLSTLAGASIGDASQRRTYTAALHGNRGQLIEDVAAAEADLSLRETELRDAASKVDAKRTALAQMKSSLQQNVSDTQALLDQTKGDLAVAVQAEQARVAAEQQAQAEAQARAADAQLAATRRTEATRRATAVLRVTAAGVAPAPAINSAGTGAKGSTGSLVAEVPPVVDAGPPVGQAATVIAIAKSQLGVPYRWGASAPGSGFDCSGLVLYAFASIGVTLPHSSRALYSMTRRLAAGELQPGDLVFGGMPVHHVGIYIGGGMMIDAPHSGAFVEIVSAYGSSKPVSFGRL